MLDSAGGVSLPGSMCEKGTSRKLGRTVLQDAQGVVGKHMENVQRNLSVKVTMMIWLYLKMISLWLLCNLL